MVNEKGDPVVIMGAGLVGALLGCYLAQRGFDVNIYERREDMRKTQMSAGRSINLALSERGISALSGVGMQDEVMKIAIPMRGRMMHSVEGTLTESLYSKDGKSFIYSVSRGDLNCKLMTLAEKREGVKIFFNHKCVDINLRNGEATLEDELKHEEFKLKGQTIFGCDGAYSSVRNAMMKLPRFDYQQFYITHGYKELHMPDINGKHKMDMNYLHIWPRGNLMMIALPNLDGSFTCTCFFPFEGKHGFDYLDNASDEEVSQYFKNTFPDAFELMPDLVKDFKTNPTSALITVKCFPWSHKGVCTLFGDAAHAIVPFFGQGMNAAFEDCRIFNEKFNEHCGNDYMYNPGENLPPWEKIFHDYHIDRKPNADSIADLALENFIEMRDLVADPLFLFKKKVQHLLGNTYPGRFLTRYEMISFTNIPYKETIRLGKIADDMTDQLISHVVEKVKKINLDDADNSDKLMKEYLSSIDMSLARDLMDKYFPNPII